MAGESINDQSYEVNCNRVTVSLWRHLAVAVSMVSTSSCASDCNSSVRLILTNDLYLYVAHWVTRSLTHSPHSLTVTLTLRLTLWLTSHSSYWYSYWHLLVTLTLTGHWGSHSLIWVWQELVYVFVSFESNLKCVTHSVVCSSSSTFLVKFLVSTTSLCTVLAQLTSIIKLLQYG